MNVTQVQVPERDQCLGEIEKLVVSHVLHGSESLCKLLRYLAENALDHPGLPVKEYQIATELFGRSRDFDPQLDSTIRVQAGRLRMKLAEYYAAEGAEDPIVVEVPKGAYVLFFHHRPIEAAEPLAFVAGHGAGAEDAAGRRKLRHRTIALVVQSFLLAAAVALIVSLLTSTRIRPSELQGPNQPAPAVFITFWKGFLQSPGEPWVIFSNGAFVGRPETGMRYFNAATDSRGVILDHYTGVGEVLAVHDLDEVFERLHRQIRVKRGSLFSLDDAKNNDLIFVGSPAENLTLRDIPSTQEFIFQRLDSGPRKGDLAIGNVHPKPGEPAFFLGSPSNTLLAEDYAVIALVRGMEDPTRSVLILAGTTTIGTQAAVEYVCEQKSLQELLQRLNTPESGSVTPFEAVLRVKVTRGVPVESTVVALRKAAAAVPAPAKGPGL